MLAAAASAAAQSHGTIRGRIVASADGSAIGGARLTLMPAGGANTTEATSDASGHFHLPLVAPGAYTLSTHAEGFAGGRLPSCSRRASCGR